MNTHIYLIDLVCVCVCVYEDNFHASRSCDVIECRLFAFLSCFHAQMNVCSALSVFCVYTVVGQCLPPFPC